ncbi:MAG: hypothetical protein M3Z04_20695 [Chloroflexota bacterium]|nr:hypothetical protein [Chloroflexota bacterium]
MSGGAEPPPATPLVAAPLGVVSFLFTALVGGPRLWAEQPERMTARAARYDALVAAAIAPYSGYLFQTAGEVHRVAFADAAQAVAATLALARALQAAGADPVEPQSPFALRVRLALHCGPHNLGYVLTGGGPIRTGDGLL